MKKLFVITALVAIAALVVFNIFGVKPKTSQSSNVQTEIPPALAASENSVPSPDGSKTLVMKVAKGFRESTYSFFTSGTEIFNKTVANSVSFSIPANTWSPDNKYVFIKETGDIGSVFFVLSASLDSSTQDDKTANITDTFAKKYPDLTIQDATGWGGVSLVVFNSQKADGTNGPSFWYEMPSHAVIQLANHFN